MTRPKPKLTVLNYTKRAGKLWRVLVALPDGSTEWLQSQAWVARDRK